jgi:hypothetical protein
MARLKQLAEEDLRRAAEEHRRYLLAGDGISLLKVPFQNPFIQMLWREHYVGSKGTVGRQLHYIVYFNGHAVGGISAGSAIFAHKKRDKYLGIGEAEKRGGIRHIVNNTMFRMIRPSSEEPKATAVLSVFKTTAIDDWYKSYGDHVRAFETLVEPPRWGGIYKLDGWRRIGNTMGLGARRPEGHGTAGRNSTGVRKIIKVPVKIVWVQPICSYEEAIARSDNRNSFGDDSKLVAKCLAKANGKGLTPKEIAHMAGVPMERIPTILYLLSNGAEKKLQKLDDGRYTLSDDLFTAS